MGTTKTFVFLIFLCPLVTSQLTKPDGCGSDVGCYHDCGDDNTCTYVVSWKDTGNSVDFTLSLNLGSGSGNQWIALGLSEDTSMGEDSVTDCIQNSGSVIVQKSYNPGRSNEVLTDPTEGITVGASSANNGILSCSYRQTKTSSSSRIFDLETDWYMLVATGQASSGSKNPHSFSDLPDISSRLVDLQSTDDVTGSAKAVLVKVHGSLMMFAWIFCASIGIVCARYYKPMWPRHQMCKKDMWFGFHRICMVSAFLCCIAAFIIIFVDVEGWSYLEGSSHWLRAHPYLGVIVTALCIINPMMAIVRPHPDAKSRFIFNWAHWGVGTLAHVLSALTLIMGVSLGKASAPFYLVWILVAWILYQVLVELLLESFACCFTDTGKRVDLNGVPMDPRDSTFKNVLLMVHLVVITGFTVACIVILNLN